MPLQNYVCLFLLAHDFKIFQSSSISIEVVSLMLFLCIRLEQFNDVLFQENGLNPETSHPLFDSAALQTIQTEKSISVELVQVLFGHIVSYTKTNVLNIINLCYFFVRA